MTLHYEELEHAIDPSEEEEENIEMKGYTGPLSPSGKSSLVDPTPHHISAEAIQVIFSAGAETAKRFLPAPLEPLEDGLAFAYVADMIKVPQDDPDLPAKNPERTQYKEGILGFYCQHGGKKGRISNFVWVTKDWSVVFGQMMGWGKKLGRVNMTRLHDFNPAMKGGLQPGRKLSGVVDRQGYRLMQVSVSVEKEGTDADLPEYGNRVFLHRRFPSIGDELPGTDQLLYFDMKSVVHQDVWVGGGEVWLGESDNEELAGIQVKEVVGGYYFKRGWTTTGRVNLLHDYSKEGVASGGES